MRVLIVLIVLGLAGCSSSKPASSGENKPEKDPITTVKDPSPSLSSSLQTHCDSMEALIKQVVGHHYNADLNQTPQYLTQGVRRWSKEVTLKLDVDEIKDADFCTTFSQTMEQLMARVTNKEKAPDLFLFETHALLDTILQEIDYFTSVVWDTSQRLDFAYTGFELPVSMIERSDYHWRNPAHLVVNPFYQGSLVSVLPHQTKIFKIGKYEIKQNPFDKTKSLMRYALPEEEVTLSVQYPNQSNITQIHVPVKQTNPEQTPVLSSTLDEDILYLRIANISEKSKDAALNHINHALQKIKNPKGLILDLRGNPGGIGHFAAKIASFFLPAQTPIFASEESTFDSTTGQKKYISTLYSHDFEPDATTPSWDTFDKILILVDRTSASSSEVITAALTFNAAAITLGETTFGKGIGTIEHQWSSDKLPPIKITKAMVYGWPTQAYLKATNQSQQDWITWQAQGLPPMIAVKDPVLEHLEKNPSARDRERPFSMKDMARFDFKILDQEPLKSTLRDTLHPPTELLIQNRLAHLRTLQTFAKNADIASCKQNAYPGGALFDESKECIFDLGLAVMKHWIALD